MVLNIYKGIVIDIQVKDNCNFVFQNGMECFEVLIKEGDLLVVNLLFCGSDCDMLMIVFVNEQGIGFSEIFLNLRLNEIR